jgi:hypothetical protein
MRPTCGRAILRFEQIARLPRASDAQGLFASMISWVGLQIDCDSRTRALSRGPCSGTPA